MLRTLAALMILASCAASALAVDDYTLGPDSLERGKGVPEGKVEKQSPWKSKIFEGTERDWSIYVSAQYDAAMPACLMVFQDGVGMANTEGKGQYRVPIVCDNLIARGEMPITIGVFINPGSFPATKKGEKPRSNRSFEYDSLGDQYARFLIDEIIPEVKKRYAITDDPKGRAICGNSSGGICAFNVAWERPDQFAKVVSHIGSFTNIRGGNVIPFVIRKTEPKPIRVFLQDGSSDLDNAHGNWPLANQEMAAALKFINYDYKFVYGDGAHSGKHGGSIFPDTMRWLWRDYPGVKSAQN
ncbi:MAG TPA: alpha/beta hydrolase-fold protein [Pirellulales bacterium]|jgi:enterochelin esterase family protein|nr:alpha/beta hydrolase-fold protein [Pirellulales bacterium]